MQKNANRDDVFLRHSLINSAGNWCILLSHFLDVRKCISKIDTFFFFSHISSTYIKIVNLVHDSMKKLADRKRHSTPIQMQLIELQDFILYYFFVSLSRILSHTLTFYVKF